VKVLLVNMAKLTHWCCNYTFKHHIQYNHYMSHH